MSSGFKEVNSGVNSLNIKVDLIREDIIDIKGILNRISSEINSYQELVAQQIENARSEEEKERTIHVFSEVCTNKIMEQISKNNSQTEFNKFEKLLEMKLGKVNWGKIEHSSRTFLISAKIMFFNMIELENIVDYSGVCLLITKSLEVELSKRFHAQFVNYLDRKYPISTHPSYWPTSITYNSKGSVKKLREKDFTLGTIAFLFGHKKDHKLSLSQLQNNEKILLEFVTKELFYSKYSQKEIKDFLKDFAQDVENVRVKYRNPSAHKNELKSDAASECFEYVIEVERVLAKLLDMVKK
ncbi:hypothetical protein A6P54_02570 [Bacillus sp. MKU004]|nr:hypothetical protein A6P54_02570 [Bacillus sp. MKU004]